MADLSRHECKHGKYKRLSCSLCEQERKRQLMDKLPEDLRELYLKNPAFNTLVLRAVQVDMPYHELLEAAVSFFAQRVEENTKQEIRRASTRTSPVVFECKHGAILYGSECLNCKNEQQN